MKVGNVLGPCYDGKEGVLNPEREGRKRGGERDIRKKFSTNSL